MTDERVVPPGILDVVAQPGVGDGPVEGAAVTEHDVVGERAGQHPRHLRDVRHLARPQEDLRVVDLDPVPRDRAGVVDQAGEAAQQARLARPDLPEEQHEFTGADREVDPLDAAGAVVVDGTDIAQLELAQRDVLRGGRSGCGALDEVDAGREGDEVDTPGEGARRLLPGPGSRRLGDDGSGDPAEPVEPVDGTRDEDRGGQAPAPGGEGRPGSDHPDLHHDHRHAVEDGLHPVLEHGRVDPAAVDPAQVAAGCGGGRGQLDGPRGFEDGHQGAAEGGPGRGGFGGRAPRDGPPDGRGEGRTDEHPEQHTSGQCTAAEDRGDGDDGEPVEEVDPAVGVEDVAVGIHRAGHDLTGRRALEPVLSRLPDQDRHAHPQQHLDPPARVAPNGRGHEQR